ncbi:MAG: hypothetical protein BJ554DRAFT_2914, partial [Olpidium bornovanus]
GFQDHPRRTRRHIRLRPFLNIARYSHPLPGPPRNSSRASIHHELLDPLLQHDDPLRSAASPARRAVRVPALRGRSFDQATVPGNRRAAAGRARVRVRRAAGLAVRCEGGRQAGESDGRPRRGERRPGGRGTRLTSDDGRRTCLKRPITPCPLLPPPPPVADGLFSQ